jgi:23S rRNA (uracil1939-C5)-methyltransferase
MNGSFETVVESIVQGGDGIARHNGMAVFLPAAAPNERVLAHITSKKKNFARGVVTQILEPSPERVEARCAHFGVCGGCQLQHLSYDAQLKAKVGFVSDALTRIARLEAHPQIEVFAADDQWGYRRHIRLKLWSKSGAYQLGFFEAKSHEGVAMQTCHIFLGNKGEQVFHYLRALVQELEIVNDAWGHLTILKHGTDRCVLGFEFASNKPKNIERVLAKALSETSMFAGALVSCNGKKQIFGDITASFKVKRTGFNEEFVFFCRPDAFVQSHPAQSERLYNDIIDKMLKAGSKQVLDLYCGIGVLSVMLAKAGLRPLGVELSPVSIELAKQNANHNGVDIEWHCSPAEQVAGKLLHAHNPDTILLNPPRTGVSPELLQAMIAKRPRHIFYMSCMPPTMARDIKILTEAGYAMKSCRACDMFPQTTHVETLIHLEACKLVK